MGCSNFLTNQNIVQILASFILPIDTGWKPVPADKRYEEKIVRYESGRTTRMTRLAGQPTEYPHYTQYYNAKGQSEVQRTHYSTAKGKEGDHPNAHKTVDAVLADLDEAINSLRSSR